MYTDKDDLIINNINMGEYLQKAIYSFNDTWSDNSGYNTLSGKFVGEFKGVYPKISLQFRPLTPNEIEYLTQNIFRNPYQTTKFRDIDGTLKTIQTHKGDVQISWYAIDKSEPFTFEIVGNDKL